MDWKTDDEDNNYKPNRIQASLILAVSSKNAALTLSASLEANLFVGDWHNESLKCCLLIVILQTFYDNSLCLH